MLARIFTQQTKKGTGNMNLTTFNFNQVNVRTVTDEQGNPWFVAADVCEAFGIEEDAFLQFALERDKTFVALDGQDYRVVTDFGACAALYHYTAEGSDHLRRLVCLELLQNTQK